LKLSCQLGWVEKVLLQQVELLFRSLHTHQIIQYVFGVRASLQLPADMLASDLHAMNLTIKIMQASQVITHDLMDLAGRRRL